MRAWQRILIQLGVPVAVLSFYFLVPIPAADAPVGTLAGVIVAVVCLVFIGWVIVLELRRAQKQLQPIHLLLAFELVLLVFALIYYVMYTRDPTQFEGMRTRLDALYFSVVTTATVGYGDVHAISQTARAVVTAQIAFNVVFVAGIVALLQAQIRARSEARISPPPSDTSTSG